MCGAYSIVVPGFDVFDRRFRLTAGADLFQSRYNARPSHALPVIVQASDGHNRCEVMEWGLMPAWAKDRIINARDDKVEGSKFFSPLLRYRRCLIPASSFFE